MSIYLLVNLNAKRLQLYYEILYYWQPISNLLFLKTGAENGAEIDDKLLFSVNCNDIINRKGSGKKAYYFIYIDHN